jgi:recombination protein RecA
MTVTFIGADIETPRFKTNCWSFDHALYNPILEEIGLPMRSMVEIFGPAGTGKTTIALSLAAWIAAKDNKGISIADLEGTDRRIMESILSYSGFSGMVALFNEGTDEKDLGKMVDELRDPKKFCVGIVDAVGAISPYAERKGDLGDSNMGRRGRIMADFTRNILHLFLQAKNKDSVVFILNHSYPAIGWVGNIAPGGKAKEYGSKVRISISRAYKIGDKGVKLPETHFLIKGKVVKNNRGVSGREFLLAVEGGLGIHRGLTAVFDCLAYKLAILDRIVKIDNVSYGGIKDMCGRPSEDEFFAPFHEVLVGNTASSSEIGEENEE